VLERVVWGEGRVGEGRGLGWRSGCVRGCMSLRLIWRWGSRGAGAGTG